MTRRFGRFLRRNTIALLALFLALGGTTFAATGYPANIIGAKQLKKNAVTTPKIKNGAVTGAKIAKNTITGANVLESSLAKVPSAKTADNATHATNADNATTATTATSLTAAGSYTDIPLNTGWVDDSSASGTYQVEPYAPGFYKDREGYIHLRGAADRTSGSAPLIGTLPAGARPPGAAGKYIYFEVYTTAGAAGGLYVGTDGTLTLNGGSAGFVSLDGVTFRQGN